MFILKWTPFFRPGVFASFLKGPLSPSGHRIERRTIDLQSDINCLPERSLLGAFGKQHDDYDHDVFNSAGSTLATPHFGPENGVHLILPSSPSSRSTRSPSSRTDCLQDLNMYCRIAGAAAFVQPLPQRQR